MCLVKETCQGLNPRNSIINFDSKSLHVREEMKGTKLILIAPPWLSNAREWKERKIISFSDERVEHRFMEWHEATF